MGEHPQRLRIWEIRVCGQWGGNRHPGLRRRRCRRKLLAWPRLLQGLLDAHECQVQRDLLLPLFMHRSFQGGEVVWYWVHQPEQIFDHGEALDHVGQGDLGVGLLPGVLACPRPDDRGGSHGRRRTMVSGYQIVMSR
jgi:hypothetical protein